MIYFGKRVGYNTSVHAHHPGGYRLAAGGRMAGSEDPRRRLSDISTRWSLLLDAQRGQGDTAREAQRLLLLRYCGAVHRYLLGAVGDVAAAEELTQEFALRFVRGDFRRADPGRGRFRDFLKTALQRLVTDYRRQQHKQPAALPAHADQLPAPEPPPWPSDAQFLGHWRQELLDGAWAALEQAQEPAGPPFYTVLRWRAENPQAPAAELAERLTRELGRPFSEDGVRQTLRRAREKFAGLLLDEVGRSLDSTDPEPLTQELIDLDLLAYCRSALARRSGKDASAPERRASMPPP
jgi:RNA polymerase sigma-70 factor (ECF subfamily)